jgi:uncharacterized protein (TIGR03067 family)
MHMRRATLVLTLTLAVAALLLPWGSNRAAGQWKGQWSGWEHEAERDRDREIAALQGTWRMLRWEENGKMVPLEDLGLHWHVKGGKMVAEEKGKVIGEGKLEYLEATRTPALMDIHWFGRKTDTQIYVRAGDLLIMCGNRDGGPRPTCFKTGCPAGGTFLVVFQIER